MFFFFGKRDKHSCSASAIISLSMVSIVDTCCQRFTHQPILFCVVRPTHISLGLAMRAVSLFFFSGAAALFSRVSRLRRSTLARACTPLTKSEEKKRLLAVYYMSGKKITSSEVSGRKFLPRPNHPYSPSKVK